MSDVKYSTKHSCVLSFNDQQPVVYFGPHVHEIKPLKHWSTCIHRHVFQSYLYYTHIYVCIIDNKC